MTISILECTLAQSDYEKNLANINVARTTVKPENLGQVTVYRILDKNEDILAVAEKEFPTAGIFVYVSYEGNLIDDTFLKEHGQTLRIYHIGTTLYDAKNDMFMAAEEHLPFMHGNPLNELLPGNIMLNPETRIPYFTCPKTTATDGTRRGDQIFDAQQLKNLSLGRPAGRRGPQTEPNAAPE
jgi:hypothetical protein